MMHGKLRLTSIAAAVVTACVASSAWATNGMLMEGYGPESTAMGGAAMAFDNGAAAMVGNPATLSLMKDGASRIDVSLGFLQPDVSATVPTSPTAKTSVGSDGDLYLMPAAGWATRNGQVSYGIGVFSQGGMGTEYDKNSPMMGARSEVGVGAFLLPASYQVNNQLSIGGTLQYVWGGMDLIMGMPMLVPDQNGNPSAGPGSFFDFMPGAGNALGSASGSLVQGLGGVFQSQQNPTGPVDPNGKFAVFDFSNDDDFSGKTKGAGFSARLGFLFQVSPELSIGGAYQAETAMDDWDGKGTMAIIDGATGQPATMPTQGGGSVPLNLPGTYTVKDFQFPATFTLGMAYKVDKWLLAADITQIDWSGVMKDFNLNFTVDKTVPGFGGASVDVTMKQEWDDQTVIKLGAAYEVNDQLTVRGGLNLANNPVPDKYLNALFPAIIKNHVTMGATYKFSDAHSIAGSLVFAPEVDQTNSQTQVESTHSQTNIQVMYSYRY